MRPTRAGLAGGAIYVVLGLIWVVGFHPPGSPWAYVAWLVIVAIAACFVPGAANQVSMARAYLAAPGFAYSGPSSLGLLAVVVALAGLTDLVDGTIARRFDRPSKLGGGLDPVVDGIFLGAVAIGLANGGAFPVWLAVVVIARYFLPALVGGVLLARGQTPELRHTLAGQISTALILVLLGGIALFRFLGQDATNVVVGAEIVIPIATVATFIHLGVARNRGTGVDSA